MTTNLASRQSSHLRFPLLALDLRVVVLPPSDAFAGDDVPGAALGPEPLVDVVRPGERASLQVGQVDAASGQVAEVDVDHGGAVERFNVTGHWLVGPGPRVRRSPRRRGGEPFNDLAVMAAGRVEAGPVDDDVSVHKNPARGPSPLGDGGIAAPC